MLYYDILIPANQLDTSRLRSGDYVKLSTAKERFWVSIKSINGSRSRKVYIGVVDNTIITDAPIKRGDEIMFQDQHIFDVIHQGY